jgi:hypothetical protein
MKPTRRGRIRNDKNTARRRRVEPDKPIEDRHAPPSNAQDRRQIWTFQVAAFVQAVCIALGAVAVKLFLPFHHVCLAPVFLDEPAYAVAAFAGALGAFDAEHVAPFIITAHQRRCSSRVPMRRPRML